MFNGCSFSGTGMASEASAVNVEVLVLSNQVTSHCFVYYVRSIAAVDVVFQFSCRKIKSSFFV